MTQNDTRFDALFDAVENTLTMRDLSGDIRLLASICLAFCDLLSLDNAQRVGVEDARQYWDGKLSDDRRLKSLSYHSDKLSELNRQGDGTSRQEAIQRLVTATLIVNEGLSPMAGEFLVDLGCRAGLSVENMTGVFQRLLPGFVLD